MELSKTSKKILTKLNQLNIDSKILNPIKNPPLHLKKIMEKYKVKFEKITPIKIKYSNIPKWNLKQIKYYVEGKFLAKNTIREIDKLKYWYNINFEFGNIKLAVSKRRKLNSVLEQLPNLLRIIKTISNGKKINALLFLTDLKKKWPQDNTMNPNSVNSGYTYIIGKKIVIYRYEEWEKLLIHESIHSFNLDQYKLSQNKYFVKFNMFEAITDFWTVLLHCIYISFMLKKSWQEILLNEYKFIYVQSNYLLKKIWKINLLNENNLDKELKKVKEKTNSFSYYVFKFMLFYYIDEWKYYPIEEKKDINELIKILKLGYPKINKIKGLYNSTRMTCYQLLS